MKRYYYAILHTPSPYMKSPEAVIMDQHPIDWLIARSKLAPDEEAIPPAEVEYTVSFWCEVTEEQFKAWNGERVKNILNQIPFEFNTGEVIDPQGWSDDRSPFTVVHRTRYKDFDEEVDIYFLSSNAAENGDAFNNAILKHRREKGTFELLDLDGQFVSPSLEIFDTSIKIDSSVRPADMKKPAEEKAIDAETVDLHAMSSDDLVQDFVDELASDSIVTKNRANKIRAEILRRLKS